MDQGGALIPTIQPARLGEGARRVGPRVLGVEHQADGDGGHVLRQVLACQRTCSGARSAHRPRMKRESLPFRPSALGFTSQSRAGQMSHSGQNPTSPAAARQSPNIKTSTAHAPRGGYLSLEEARNAKQIAQFCKEHPSECDGDRFTKLLSAMARKRPTADQTSFRAASAYCSDTQTPSRTSEGASVKRERGSRESTASTAPKNP